MRVRVRVRRWRRVSVWVEEVKGGGRRGWRKGGGEVGGGAKVVKP